MADSRTVKKYYYSSAVAKPLIDFVAEKRGSGFLYNSEAKMLYRFDKYIADLNQRKCCISRETFESYTAKTVHDSERNHRARLSLIRQFAIFVNKHGYDAYVPSIEKNLHRPSKFVPYIFSESELQRLFEAADSYKLHLHGNNNSKLELILPIIFKMLYGGGFRISELTHLKLSDVDFKNCVVKIVHSKFGNERYVPLSASLIDKLKVYIKKARLYEFGDNSLLFPKHDGSVYSEKAMYENFRRLLWVAGISHGGKGNGPRLHDIRHTFAVHRLKYWARQGCDVITMLPCLSAYLGHKNLNATQDYLRLTVDAFPDVVDVLEKTYSNIIPQIGGVPYAEE